MNKTGKTQSLATFVFMTHPTVHRSPVSVLAIIIDQ